MHESIHTEYSVHVHTLQNQTVDHQQSAVRIIYMCTIFPRVLFPKTSVLCKGSVKKTQKDYKKTN